MSERIEHSWSGHDGIVFISDIRRFIGVESTITDDGEIIVERNGKDYSGNFLIERLIFEKYFPSKRRTLGINLILISFAIASMNIWVILGSLLFIFTFAEDFYRLLICSYEIKFGNEKRIGRFHAAKHMAVDSYNELGRVPTIEEMKKYSRFSKNCGCQCCMRAILLGLMTSLDMIFFAGRKSVVFIIVMLIIIIFTFLDENFGTFKFIQILVTNKPTDTELMVALKGIEEFEAYSREIENNDR